MNLHQFKCHLFHHQTLPNLKISKESSKTGDIIGPPDELSNLRPIIFAKPDNETKTEKKYRLAKEKTQEWNQEFWSKHNAKFIKVHLHNLYNLIDNNIRINCK